MDARIQIQLDGDLKKGPRTQDQARTTVLEAVTKNHVKTTYVHKQTLQKCRR